VSCKVSITKEKPNKGKTCSVRGDESKWRERTNNTEAGLSLSRSIQFSPGAQTAAAALL